jgi:hypothetical protein
LKADRQYGRLKIIPRFSRHRTAVLSGILWKRKNPVLNLEMNDLQRSAELERVLKKDSRSLKEFLVTSAPPQVPPRPVANSKSDAAFWNLTCASHEYPIEIFNAGSTSRRGPLGRALKHCALK